MLIIKSGRITESLSVAMGGHDGKSLGKVVVQRDLCKSRMFEDLVLVVLEF